MDEKNVIEARKAAERAVADMPQGELKVKAFEVILGRLLSSATQPEAAPSTKNNRRRSKVRRATEPAGREPETEQSIPVSAPTRILSLKREGFFSEQRGIGEIREELQTHGWRYELTALSGTLMKLVRSRDLRRAKVNDGSKTTYKYFNP